MTIQDVQVHLQAVPRLHILLLGRVLVREHVGLPHHPLDHVLRQAPLLAGDGEALGPARALVRRRDAQDAVGIQVKRRLDLKQERTQDSE